MKLHLYLAKVHGSRISRLSVKSNCPQFFFNRGALPNVGYIAEVHIFPRTLQSFTAIGRGSSEISHCKKTGRNYTVSGKATVFPEKLYKVKVILQFLARIILKVRLTKT